MSFQKMNNTCPICSAFVNIDSWATIPHVGKFFHLDCLYKLAAAAEKAKTNRPTATFVLQDAKPCRRCERGVPELVKLRDCFFCRCQSCGYQSDSDWTQDAALVNWEKVTVFN
jgi:hypothetical protein